MMAVIDETAGATDPAGQAHGLVRLAALCGTAPADMGPQELAPVLVALADRAGAFIASVAASAGAPRP